jgi:hypothetical protein
MLHRLALLLFFVVATPLQAKDDRVLYENIVERMHEGEGYYSATSDELRLGNYPLKPPIAFRPPTLASFQALLPNKDARFVVLLALGLAAAVSWTSMLSDTKPWVRVATVVMLGCGLANVGGPNSVYLHEAWSTCFIAISIACYRKLAWCLILALMAVLIRETAILSCVALGLIALSRRDWRRAIWLVALGLFATALWVWHAFSTFSVLARDDLSSPGWVAMGGPNMVLAASKWNLLTSQLDSVWLIMALVLFAVSLAKVKRIELQVAAVFVLLFSSLLLFIGRPDNDYWGVMVSPFLAVGIPSFIDMVANTLRSKTAGSNS